MPVPIILWGAATLGALLLNGCKKNEDKPQKKGKKGEPSSNNWITIPAGSFKRGGEYGRWGGATPVKDIFVSAFDLQKHEVTNREYRAVLAGQKGKPFEAVVQCVDEQPVTISKTILGEFFDAFYNVYDACDIGKSFAISSVKNFPEEPIYSDGLYFAADRFNGDNQPALVSWFGAQAYCEAIGGRLPTEAEWEKAAKGKSGNDKYPTTPPDTLEKEGKRLAHYHERYTANVCSYPESSYGFCDLAGNVWEWVADWYSFSAYRSSETRDPKGPNFPIHPGCSHYCPPVKVMRGGARSTADALGLHPTIRELNEPSNNGDDLGFRCAR